MFDSESKTLATITLQNFPKGSSLGTAKTEEEEFREIYNMDLGVIPPISLLPERDMDDAIYATLNAKLKAIIDSTRLGQPVLVGIIFSMGKFRTFKFT